jgi:hypothetical protein
MRFRTARAARLGFSLALVSAACGVVAPSALAGGGGSQASYTVNISPATAPAGSSTTFDVAMKDTSLPGTNLGSAAFTPPLGFRVTHASLPAGASGHVYVFFNIVVLDRVNVTPGSTLHVSVTANTPSRCPNYFNHWLTVANAGGLFGRLLRLDLANSSLTTDVTCDTATELQFVTQPTDSSVNQPISPSVSVQLLDKDAGLVDSSAPVTLTLGNDPGLGTLNGTGTVTANAVHGVATFNNLSIDQPGVGYTLTASSTGLTADTSDSFNESRTTTTTCTTNPCTTDVGTSTSDLQISADPAAGTITESVDVGTPLDCSDEDNGGYTGFDANWYAFSETGTVDKTLSYELFGINSDEIGRVQMCFGAPYVFTTAGGGMAGPSTLPDGTDGFVGVLPFCDATDGVAPCVESIVPFSDDHSGALATVDVPGLTANGVPGDPMIHG